MIEFLKYFIKIKNDKILTIFDNKIKINIMLYLIILKLKLTACLKITMHIKKAENYKLFFINYISYILICIKNMKVFQFFFLLKKTNFCILKNLFKIIIQIKHMIINN